MNGTFRIVRPLSSIFLLSILFTLLGYSQAARQIAQKTFPSVVLLVFEDTNGQAVSLGSGFVVGKGVIATNLHVIEGGKRGYAKLVGQKTKYDIAGTVGIDSRRDLALLSASQIIAPPLPLGESAALAVGDEIYAVGNPQGLEGTFSQGIISSIRQVGSESLLQITAPISPGSSGGPVLNSQGKVVGIAVATFKGGQNLNFAIPASYLTSLLSNTQPVRPLTSTSQKNQGESILSDMGGKSTEGVLGGQLTWTYLALQSGEYAFSLRNQLREPVRDVYCLVIFYSSDEPIDVDVVHYSGIIPAGLAKRVTSSVDGSVQKLDPSVEFRILDFKIDE